MADFNIVLLLIVIIVSVLVFLVNIYILINYQHPDDANQAYFPKMIVVLGLSVAEISILMLPADVANKESCKQNIFNGACKLTLPMKELWLAIYIIDALLVFIVIPFSIFYYEGDQEKSPGSRACNALIWVGLLCVVIALVLGILYGVLGYVDFSVRRLSSVTVPFTTDFSSLSSSIPCFHPVGPINTNMSALCSGYNGAAGTVIWSLRTSFPAYIIALTTIAGSILFTIFGGIGIACFPLSLIFGFLKRPKCVISRAQYIKEATDLNKRAKELKTATKALQQEERSGSKGWKFKSKVKVVQKELEYLEEDVKALEEVFPQGEQAEASWALTTLWYLGKLLFGIIGFCISALWLVHIIIYLLVQPPIAPFLNQIFVRLDKAWGLLGTTAFAFFCFYLMLAVISGEVHLGMRIMFMSVHPMKYHGTLMSSFLFNVGVILLCSISVIQFCTKAFSLYAEATAAQEIFGHTLESLRGLKYLFRYNIFQFTFIILSFLTFIYYIAFGSRKPKRKGKLAFAK